MNTLHTSDCAADGGPILMDEESILSLFPRVRMLFSEYDEEDEAVVIAKGSGNLVVTTKRIVWIAEEPQQNELGYAWDTPYISLHAISRDTSSFPEACLYCHLDIEDDVHEVRFVPEDSNKTLQAMFDAFAASAALNPDEDDSDNEEGEWIYNAEEIQGAQMDIAAHLDSVLHVSPSLDLGPVPGQFDDAYEEELL
ncbi:hypothetical protein THRCLA_11075 [Thraustotheca clavata]|uniref:Uncharacterized protein n=1 Tax=Thraustotheca clavata TaxID=74557 RepID=A0A1V9Y8W7_9STRA|nr:hypothetical protein THRCLA_11075 [Thraustotheca clavata]